MRLLVLTHAFPPSTHANAKRPYYLVKGFLEAGWQVDVITHPVGMPPGGIETVVHPALRLCRLDDPLEKFFRRCRPHPWLFRLVALSAAGLMWPDTYAGWARRVFRVIRTRPTYDQTLAFILPASLLLSGRHAGLVGGNWTFDYQEPITPQQRWLTRRSPLQRWWLPRLMALERDTLHQAGRVIFTANSNREAYIGEGLVKEATTAHVPYFFDAPAFARPVGEVAADFEVVYFGSFDWRGARSPETFLRALAQFLERTPSARTRTRFVFYGSWLPEHSRFVEALNLGAVVAIRPAVGYDEYLAKLRCSPVLLLVVAPAHNLFMPSKIVDYLGARRPIMAFVPRDSEMRQVLTRAGMQEFVCEEADVAGGATVLAKLWQRHRSNALTCDAADVSFWSSLTQVPRYIELVAHRDQRPAGA